MKRSTHRRYKEQKKRKTHRRADIDEKPHGFFSTKDFFQLVRTVELGKKIIVSLATAERPGSERPMRAFHSLGSSELLY